MKTVIMVLLLILVSCSSVPKCPPEDAIYPANSPFGPIPMKIPEGYFDDKGNWWTDKEFDELIKRQGRQEKEKKDKEAGI